MIGALRLLAVRAAWANPLRGFLTTLGIGMGVALFMAVRLINTSNLDQARSSIRSLSGASSLSVMGGESGFPEEMIDVIETVPGVKSAVPRIESRVHFTSKAGGKTRTLAVLGIDLLRESEVRSYDDDDGEIIEDPLVLLNQPDSIIVTRTFAEENGFKMDDPVELYTARGAKQFVIRGIINPKGAARAFGGSLGVMDIDGARWAFGKENKSDRVDVVLKQDAPIEAVAAAIREKLGPAYSVESAEQEVAAVERMLATYNALLSFLSSLALLVGLFLVSNTLEMVIRERWRELGIVRALGASRGKILAMVLVEAMVVGACGGFLGAVFGQFLAGVLVEVVAQQLPRGSAGPLDSSDLQFQWSHVALAVGAALLTSAFAALGPALKATHVECLDAIRSKSAPSEEEDGRVETPWFGFLALVAVFVGSLLRREERAMIPSWLMPCFAVVAVTYVFPWCVSLLFSYLSRFFGPGRLIEHPFLFHLATENLLRMKSRTTRSLRPLLMGLMVVVVTSTLHLVFKRNYMDWCRKVIHFDLVVSSVGHVSTLQSQRLHENIGEELKNIPGVWVEGDRAAVGFQVASITFEGAKVIVKSIDNPIPSNDYSMLDARGQSAESMGARLFGDPEHSVLVSEGFSKRFGHKVGSTIGIDSPTGTLKMNVVGIVNEFFPMAEGVVLMSRGVYSRAWRDPLVAAFGVRLRPGYSGQSVRDEVERRLGTRGVIVTSVEDVRKEAEDGVDKTFAYLNAVALAALLVALLALFNAGVVSVIDRTRELGMLRAVGGTRRQLAKLILCESSMQGLAGGIVAAAMGIYVSYLWIENIPIHIFGSSLKFTVAWGVLGLCILAGTLVGALAGLLASSRAALVSIRGVLAQD